MQADMPIVESPLAVEEVAPRAVKTFGLPLLLAGMLALAWLLVDAKTPDLASQVYRAHLFDKFGMLVWDVNWYGGHYMPSYSLLFPPLSALLGVRVVGVLATLCSTALFTSITRRAYPRSATLGSCLFAVAAVGDLWIGRITFALGVAFGLSSVACLMRARRTGSRVHAKRLNADERGFLRVSLASCASSAASVSLISSPSSAASSSLISSPSSAASSSLISSPGSAASVSLAAVFAGLAAAASPVAGVLLALAVLTEIVAKRRFSHGLAVIAAVLIVVLPLQALFPNGGFEPYPLDSLLVSSAVGLGFVLALPRGASTLRIGGILFLAANVACLYPTPMGSNVARYAVLLAGPLLLCALVSDRRPAASLALRGFRSLVLASIVLWIVWGPINQTRIVLHDPSTSASFYRPLQRLLAARTKGMPVRIQVPFTRSHWETALLGGAHISLAGGWERQLDKRYDAAIEADPLSPSAYRNWLRRNAVAYVALPDVPLDGSSAGQARLLASAPPYLKRVGASAHWRVYEVLDSKPLLEGAGQLLTLRHDSFTLKASQRGKLLVRVRYTPYWTVGEGAGSVRQARGGWTEVIAAKPGRMRIEATFSIGRALRVL